MGRIARAKTGLYHGGGYIPIGYDYEDGKLVVNPYEAEQVRKIFEWYLAGDSLKTITDRLQDQGCLNRYGSYSSWSSVRSSKMKPISGASTSAMSELMTHMRRSSAKNSSMPFKYCGRNGGNNMGLMRSSQSIG